MCGAEVPWKPTWLPVLGDHERQCPGPRYAKTLPPLSHDPDTAGPPIGPEPPSPERRRWRGAGVVTLIAMAVAVVAVSVYGVASSGSTPGQASTTASPLTVHRTTSTVPPTTSAPTTTEPSSLPSPPAAGSHGPITSPPLPPPAPGFNAGQVTAVGDSVMLDYQTPLEQDIPGANVQAAVSQQWSAGAAGLQQLKSSGQLGAVVIVGLSTNGPISNADFATMMGILSGASRVVFINVHVDRPWQDPNNAVLAAGVQQYPNTVLADWNGLASQNPGWLYSDGTHLPIDGPGAQALANLVAAQA